MRYSHPDDVNSYIELTERENEEAWLERLILDPNM